MITVHVKFDTQQWLIVRNFGQFFDCYQSVRLEEESLIAFIIISYKLMIFFRFVADWNESSEPTGRFEKLLPSKGIQETRTNPR